MKYYVSMYDMLNFDECQIKQGTYMYEYFCVVSDHKSMCQESHIPP